jgi:hypothetical protein
LSGAGQVAGADDDIRFGIEDIFYGTAEPLQIDPVLPPETVIEYPHPAFIKIGQPIFSRPSRVGIGKMYDFQSKPFLKSLYIK